MNSITACRETGQHHPTIMDFHYTNGHRKALRKAQAASFLLTLFAHLALWLVYQATLQAPPVEIQPLPIVVSLVAAKAQAAAPAMAQPQPPAPKPQVQPPPPKPKPVPKVEKPAPVKPEKPKPTPKPKPRPEPKAEAEPTPEPEAVAPAPPAPPAPPAAAQATKAEPNASSGGEAAEDTHFSQGTVGHYGSMPYPAIARERGWDGVVKVEISVSADGEIEAVRVASSSGHEVLDEYAVEKVQSASKIVPCHRGPKPVACKFTQPLQFKLTKE